MEYHLKSRKEVEDFIKTEVLTTSEAKEILGVTTTRMSQLISGGKLTPIKKLRGVSLFLRSDIERKKKELEESRKKYRPYDK
ncbi:MULTISPECIES: helix-turn-helix domain-containing protein [Bacillus]|uniref:Helix-turn-helix domain-containing protein n=1 Tax=Bacillus amyloliquefaciens TaxID=1390 RepID=A0AAP3YDU4_BACAM|nr:MULTISPECIES: helix-turn-helix domain-containing protein [Bacillus]MDF4193895.1 helix-turn-helix domain-containing protein [Bacillus amyloliquefaciens]MDF4213926.1 helix-turn-helix domain-containing protein [Bacillus amyloliquefaciens]NCT27082.1 helix-turn-helix domain-containing protein [Bacillus velezensis]NMP62403.1 helix-turn-helix domain-containing protein [Bacillus velezensis]POO71556.1 DNA-binding protein [Bacillus amyloliquefaciens]